MGECSLCDQIAVVVVNGAAACSDHVEEVMRGAFRGVAVFRGLDPDEVERKTEHLIENTKEQMRCPPSS